MLIDKFIRKSPVTEEKPTRSNEPIFWSLFSAGGMLAAILAPVMIVIVGFIIPFADAATLTNILKLTQSIWFQVFILAMIVLPIWCGLHRILHTLYDFKIKPKRGQKVFYFIAFLWTCQAIYVVFFL